MLSPLYRQMGPIGMATGGAVADWWPVTGKTCVAAYQPKGAASLAASYVNLANPGTYDAAPGTAPTLGAAGWAFVAASSQYLTTGIIPTNNQTWSMLLRFSSAVSAVSITCGYADSAAFQLCPDYTNFVLYGTGQNKLVAPGLSSGVIGIAGNTAYRNGSAESGAISATAGTFKQLYIGARNITTGAPNLFWGGTVAAFAIYSDTLTAGEMAARSTAMAAL